MIHGRRWVRALVGCSLLAGCSAETSQDAIDVAVTSAALSVCEETVPGDRSIDGIPAYAQCEASQNSAIYSNNGIDTATMKVGPDWVRTQYSGGYQCTELAHRYLVFKWGIDWVPRGNAGSWCDTPPPESIGIVQTMTPVHGDIMVLAPGSCGASSSTGHATVVDQVDASGRLVVVEQNRARRGTYQQSCAKCFLHVVANDGTPGPVTTAGSGAMAAGTGGTTGGTAGTGAAGAGAFAGTMAPPPQMPPAMTPPPTIPPPAMEPPAPSTPASPVPDSPVPMAGTSASVGAGGSASTPLPAGVAPRPIAASSTSDEGCSVARPGARGAGRTGSSCALLLGLAWFLHRLRGRRAR